MYHETTESISIAGDVRPKLFFLFLVGVTSGTTIKKKEG